MDQTTNQSSAKWYAVGAVVIVAFAFWYFYMKQSPAINTQPTAVEQVQTLELSGGNTTADITTDLNQVSDSSAALNADATAAANALKGL